MASASGGVSMEGAHCVDFELTKIGSAVEQLDWAIRLFLDHKAFVPAITLAGAAEEVLGRRLGERAASKVLKDDLADLCSMDGRAVSEKLNMTRNWVKHWDDSAGDRLIHSELEEDAIQYIVRALANLACLDRPLRSESEGLRFLDWLKANKPDMWQKQT
jgi:hypothetical protein